MLKHIAIAAFVLCAAFPAFSEEAPKEAIQEAASDAGAETAVSDPDKPTAPADKAKAKESKIHAFAVGDIKGYALLNTMGEGNVGLLLGAGPDDLERAAKPGALATSINAFILEMDGKTILFDAGLPPEPSGGILPALKEAGIEPEDIEAIVITHFHFDHVGGLLDKDGKAVYPKAELYVAQPEIDKWSDPGTNFLMVYGARSNVFPADREILPGITAVPAYGHTPGHMMFRVEKGDDTLLIIGDLIHLPGVQLVNPDVAVTYDKDPVAAVAVRKRVFAKAAAEKLPIASMHIPFPGMGVLVADGEGYVFEELGD